jgi:hypothetical protein
MSEGQEAWDERVVWAGGGQEPSEGRGILRVVGGVGVAVGRTGFRSVWEGVFGCKGPAAATGR